MSKSTATAEEVECSQYKSELPAYEFFERVTSESTFGIEQHVEEFSKQHKLIDTYEWKDKNVYVVNSAQTGKPCAYYVVDPKKASLVGVAFTTGHRSDNFTSHFRNNRVENYTFGILKAKAASHRALWLTTQETLKVTDFKTKAVSDVPAHEFLQANLYSIVKGVRKLYETEQERPTKGKTIRFTHEDPAVAFCLDYDTSVDPATLTFPKLQVAFVEMVERICELLPTSHQVVAKMGVGRSVPFALLDRMNELDALEAGVALTRAYLAMDPEEVAFYATDLGVSNPIIQEFSLEDDLWAHKVPADVYKARTGEELQSSLQFGNDEELLDWVACRVLPGADMRKLAQANDKAFKLIKAAYRDEDTEALVKTLWPAETIAFLHNIGFLGFCDNHIGDGAYNVRSRGKMNAPMKRFGGDVSFYAEKVAKGDFDMVEFFDRLSVYSEK